MNAKLLAAAVMCTAFGSTLIAQQPKEQRVTAGELPAAVQKALQESSQGEPIKTINRRVIDGRTVYDVELERANALNPRFRITEDGIVVAGTSRAASDSALEAATTYDGLVIPATLFDPAVTLNELPAAVRETLKKESVGRQIADIDRESWQGRTVYEVEFKEPGRNPQIHIAEDGTIVKSDQARGGPVSGALRSLFMGTQLVDTPPAVQETIRREARERPVRDIDAKRRKGQRIYEVEIGDGHSGFQLHVAEDGRILQDTRAEASPAKRG